MNRNPEPKVAPRDVSIPCTVCTNPLGHYVNGGKRYCRDHVPTVFWACWERAQAARAAA